MSSLHQQQEQPQMLPAVQDTGQGQRGCSNEPQNASDVEDQMVQQARQTIGTRLKMAKLFQRYKAQLIFNKHDVIITSAPRSVDEKICLTVYENKKVVPLAVRNCDVGTVYLTFWASDLVKNIFTVTDCRGNIIETVKQLLLGPGEVFEIQVHFCSEHAGFYEHLLVFEFQRHKHASDKFEIMHLLEVVRRTSFDEEPLPTTTTSLCDLSTTDAIDAKGLVRLPFVVPLGHYQMPNSIKDLEKSEMDLEKTPLTWKNYEQRFHLLLHVEELQLKTQIEKFNQEECRFSRQSNPDLFLLQIASVAMGPPSILSRNQVLATPLDHQAGAFDKDTRTGWVRHVDGEKVYLQFNKRFLSCFKEGMRFRVDFLLHRTTLRMQHRAAELVYSNRLGEMLFPTGQFSSHLSHLHRLTEFEMNPEQHSAIQHIVAATAKPAPYLVFGPPGTGKTVILVEAIKQIVKTQPSCNILACAPSNSATDHLCEKILEGDIATGKVYRLYGTSYPVAKIPPKIKFFCNLIHETNMLMIPSKYNLMQCKILLTTLQTAGRLVSGGIPPNHYTYLFVDEAGQATETECLIPIAGLMQPQKCQVVLAGDPKQLGPVIMSAVAVKHGLGVSMLERLIYNISLYKSDETHGFNNRFITKLLRNYRTHPAILQIPNELFYNGELQPYGHKATCDSYCEWKHLPKKGFPLIFHGVAGTDERDSSSPSVYNMAEVEVLKEYLKALIDRLHKRGVTKIGPREIGIIAPYRKQVEKIQNALQTDKDLRKEDLENVLVGTVEQFQGKEFIVTLVSTVRSNPKLTKHNQLFSIGFVDNEKRFNVAMTRARALLIVVGDPRVLNTNQIWNKFIHYCFKEGGYRGITVSDAEEDMLTDEHSPWRALQQLDPC